MVHTIMKRNHRQVNSSLQNLTLCPSTNFATLDLSVMVTCIYFVSDEEICIYLIMPVLHTVTINNALTSYVEAKDVVVTISKYLKQKIPLSL